MLIGDTHPYVMSDRIAYLIERFTKRHKLHKARVQWDEDELSELSMNLSGYIRDSMTKWNGLNQRLDHMRLRLIQISHDEMESADKEDTTS